MNNAKIQRITIMNDNSTSNFHRFSLTKENSTNCYSTNIFSVFFKHFLDILVIYRYERGKCRKGKKKGNRDKMIARKFYDLITILHVSIWKLCGFSA